MKSKISNGKLVKKHPEDSLNKNIFKETADPFHFDSSFDSSEHSIDIDDL